MVEYGPVEIGGTSHICPVESVSLTVERTVKRDSQYKLDLDARTGSPQTQMNEVPSDPDATEAGPPLTKLNDVRFKEYHQFRAEMRILTGDE
jgi:hypothetical protein